MTTAGISLARPGEGESKGIVLTAGTVTHWRGDLKELLFCVCGALTNEITQYLIFFFLIAILEVKEVNNHFICQTLGKNWTKGANWGNL